MSGYLMDMMKPIRDNEDFKGAVRNVKNNQKRAIKVKRVIFKGDGSLDTLFSIGFKRETQVVLDSSHGRATAKKGNFQRRRMFWHTFCMVLRDTQCVLHSSHVRPGTFEPDETNQTQ